MWKYSGAAKSPTSNKNVVLKNSESSMNSCARSSSASDNFSLELSSCDDHPGNEAVSELFHPSFLCLPLLLFVILFVAQVGLRCLRFIPILSAGIAPSFTYATLSTSF